MSWISIVYCSQNIINIFPTSSQALCFIFDTVWYWCKYIVIIQESYQTYSEIGKGALLKEVQSALHLSSCNTADLHSGSAWDWISGIATMMPNLPASSKFGSCLSRLTRTLHNWFHAMYHILLLGGTLTSELRYYWPHPCIQKICVTVFSGEGELGSIQTVGFNSNRMPLLTAEAGLRQLRSGTGKEIKTVLVAWGLNSRSSPWA